MKTNRRFLYSALLCMSIGWIQAQDSPYTKGLSVWFDTPTTLNGRQIWERPNAPTDSEWESQSLPIGNGNIGANILGSVSAERITFNEKSLWLGGPNTSQGTDAYWNVNKESAHVLKDIRQAFTDGDTKRATELTQKNFNSVVPYEPSEDQPFRFGNFTTAGEFYIETGLSEVGMSHYKRSLSLDSALAVVQFDKDDTHYMRRYFISHPNNMMVIRYSANQKGKQNLTFSYGANPWATGSMKPEGSDGLIYQAQLNNNGMKFCIRIRAIAQGGSVSNEQGKLTVKNADDVMFLVTADTDYKQNFDPDYKDPKTYVGVDPTATTASWMQQAIGMSYDQLYQKHYADYASLFNRVKLEINDSNQPASEQSTPQRLKNYRKGAKDSYLETLYYQYGRYLLIASSRPDNLPANLQGIWHNNTDGPWHMDYHTNINLQMNYWPACSTNLSECELPLLDFIRSLEKPGEKTAKAYFGARGWTASISANIFGFSSPLSSEQMEWNFSPVAGPWLATHIWNYYDYTRDLNYLKETGYDLIRSSADFAVDYLWRKPDGTYTAAPSTSPEHGPIDEGATFSHAVIREILFDAIEASKVLHTDATKRKQWQEVLDHMIPYQIGRYGQLMEWSKDIDDPKDEHRHVNHLFGLHPGHTISPVTTPALAQACRIVLEHRGDGATGWSMGWKLNQWARLQDGNHAYKLYGNLLKNGTLDNLWDTHPPFQIDGNFGGTAGITEMLLQSHAGFIQLLPALPDAWSKGKVSGLRARGGFEVSMEWKDGKLQHAVIHSNAGAPCSLNYQGQVLNFKTKKGKSYQIEIRNEKLAVL